MANTLESLKALTTVVADTGDFETPAAYTPQDATNLADPQSAANQYALYLMTQLVASSSSGTAGGPHRRGHRSHADRLWTKNPRNRPGARLHRSRCPPVLRRRATVSKARELIALYEAKGTARERVLIKIAPTWEGIQAAKILQQEGIRRNMTLLFSLARPQPAPAGAQLISPSSAILDW